MMIVLEAMTQIKNKADFFYESRDVMKKKQ